MTLSIIILLFLIMTGAITYFTFVHTGKHTPTFSSIDCSKYPFINKTIDCAIIDAEYSHTKSLDSETQRIIDEEKAAGHVTRASVFYRDLNTRQWFGIDDTIDFYAASLLKLPLSIIYFKLAEIDDKILNQKLTLDRVDRNSNEYFKAPETLSTEKQYTVQELIRIMLQYSDNNPVPVLNSSIDQTLRSEILHDLGIESIPSNPLESTREISVRIYANILRQLYNASYLNLDYSNTLLEYLSQTEFTSGIVAGLPKGITVAHKFGEATVSNAEGVPQLRVLHDCGIVYRPEKPYIICIMTEGHDFDQLSNVIKRITAASYKL